MREFLEKLAAIGCDIYTDKAEKAAYASSPFYTDALPLCIAVPASADQLRKIIKCCADSGIAMQMRGSGLHIRKRGHKKEYIIIETRSLNRIFDLGRANRSIIVECGVKIEAISKECKKEALFFPPATALLPSAAIGGVIAENPATASSLKYGALSAFISGLWIITASGEELFCPMQNGQCLNHGYPIAPLFCGSCGELGIITKVALRLLPEPDLRKSLFAVFDDCAAAAAASAEILSSNLQPSAFEFLDNTCAAAINLSSKDILFLQFDGSREQVERDVEEAAGIVKRLGALQVSIDSNRDQNFFAQLAFLPASLQKSNAPLTFETVTCPPERMSSLIEGIKEIAKSCGIKVAFCGNMSVTRLFIFLENKKNAQKAAKYLFTLELVLNNMLASEEDLQKDREQWRAMQKPAAELSKKLSALIDPKSLLRK